MRVLVIEDSDSDFLLIEDVLGDEFELSRSTTLAGGLEIATRQTFDLVILDLTVDDSRGFETFEKARLALGRIPVLILSGLDDEELALRAVSEGAQDYIPKSELMGCTLKRAARYAIQRRRAENAARAAEQNYRTLLDNLPTAAYTCDPDGMLTYYNKKAAEMWGQAPALNDPAYRFTGAYRLFDSNGTRIFHQQSLMAKALSERKGYNGYETQIERPDGQRRSVLTHANPVLDEDGNLLGGINVFPDISKLRETERDLRQSESFARAIVDSLTAHIAILDEQGTIIAVNSAWKRFAEQSGVLPGGFGVGANYLTVWESAYADCANSAPAVSSGIGSILGGSSVDFQLEYACDSPDGQRWFLMRATPFDCNGPERLVVSHDEITAQKTAERLAAEQLSLREAVAGMEHVLGVVGHELRTPLAALRAITEFLTTNGARETPEADEFLQQIFREVCRMSDTVNSILEVARLNSGRARWTWATIDLASTVEEAVRSIRPLIKTKAIRICNHVDQAAGTIAGDGEAIGRLLINLLSNALKHTTEGRIELFSERFTDSTGQWIDLIVTDTGCGIAPELTARLGEAFALNSGVVGTNHIGGAGLGLAICKGIAAAHGGELLFQSIQGKGTTVTARIRVDLEAAAAGDTIRADVSENLAA